MLLCDEELLKGDGNTVKAATRLGAIKLAEARKKQTGPVYDELLKRLKVIFDVH
jgi:hypothetical protein